MKTHILTYCFFSLCSKDAKFATYLDAIAKVPKIDIEGFNSTETYSFFINVYNALAVKMVIEHPCKKSIFG